MNQDWSDHGDAFGESDTHWLIRHYPKIVVLAALCAAVCFFGAALVGCQPTNKADTGKIALSHSETVYDPASGKPIKRVDDEGTSSGPSASGDLDKVKLSDGPAVITLPNGASAKSNGGSLTASFFSSETGKVVLYALGGVLVVGGAAVVYFGAVALGLAMAALGAIVIAATLYPLLWLLAALAGLVYAGYTVWHAKRSSDTAALASAAVDASASTPGLLAYLNNASDKATNALKLIRSKHAAKGAGLPTPAAPSNPAGAVAPAIPTAIPANPPGPATIISDAFPGATVGTGAATIP